MKRIRHCSCRHLPERTDQFAALLAPAGLSQYDLQTVVSLAYAEPAGAHYHDRALKNITAPDPNGHIRWIGPRPVTNGPRVQYQGRRMPAAHWLWLRAGRPDAPLTRTCHDPECIAPDHHTLASAPLQAKLVLLHARLAEFNALYPRIDFRPKKWDHSDPTRALCLRAGHPLKVYGDARARATYCRLCASDERKRLRAYAALEDQIRRGEQMGSPVADHLDAQALPDGPSLVDELLAMGAWDAHVD